MNDGHGFGWTLLLVCRNFPYQLHMNATISRGFFKHQIIFSKNTVRTRGLWNLGNIFANCGDICFCTITMNSGHVFYINSWTSISNCSIIFFTVDEPDSLFLKTIKSILQILATNLSAFWWQCYTIKIRCWIVWCSMSQSSLTYQIITAEIEHNWKLALLLKGSSVL